MQAVSGRDIAALLNPRPLVLVGACASEEADFATVAWAMPVSHNPAMFAFALRKASRTFSLIEESNACSISTFDAAGARVLDYCGTHTGWKERKADAVDHVLMPCVPDRSPDARPIPADSCLIFPKRAFPFPPKRSLRACARWIPSQKRGITCWCACGF